MCALASWKSVVCLRGESFTYNCLRVRQIDLVKPSLRINVVVVAGETSDIVGIVGDES